jgi:hypothetical protein
VLTAEPTIPAKIDPSIAWFTTISGSILPSHDTAFGTIRYPAEPIVKPIAQKIKMANALVILHASVGCSFCAIHYCATCMILLTLMVNFSGAHIIQHSTYKKYSGETLNPIQKSSSEFTYKDNLELG